MAKKTMKENEKLTLSVEKRTLLGKKLKQLRKDGILPANIYGDKFASMAVQVPVTEFIKVYKRAGETSVVYVQVDKTEIPVMIQHIQVHPLTGYAVHADLHKVDLKQKIEAEVPLTFTGEAPAVHMKVGDLLTLLDTITVEALPTEVPHQIEVDISGLANIDDGIKVGDLKAGTGYTITTDPEALIVKVAEKQEEVVAEAPAEEVPAEGETPATGGGEAAPAEDDAPKGE